MSEGADKPPAALQSAIDLIADDSYAVSFQSMAQYRSALLRELRGAPSPPAESHSADHLQRFSAWLVKEMPAGTMIGDPQWWARKLLAAACVFADEAPEPSPECPNCSVLRAGFYQLVHFADQQRQQVELRLSPTKSERWPCPIHVQDHPMCPHCAEIAKSRTADEFTAKALPHVHGKPCTCDTSRGGGIPCYVESGGRLGELWYCQKRASSETSGGHS